MNIIGIFLSDLHIKGRSCLTNLNLDSLIKSIKTKEKIDGCIVLFGGDLTNSGSKIEFLYFEELVRNLEFKLLTEFELKKVYFVMVPGNHDLSFIENNILSRDSKIITDLNIKKNWDKLIEDELKLFNNFYNTAKKYNNFLNDKIVDFRNIEINGFKIRINQLNSALFSTYSKDRCENLRDLHFIPDNYLSKLEDSSSYDVILTIAHHSNKWFFHETENKLNKFIKKSTILLNGHEHIQELSNRVTQFSNTFVIRGGEIGSESVEFSSMLFNSNDEICIIKNHDYDTERSLFTEGYSTTFETNNIPKISGLLPIDKDFMNWVNSDEKSSRVKKYTDYFVFPDLELIDNLKFDEKTIIKNWEEFIRATNKKRIIYLESSEVSGKTTFLKNIIKNKMRESYIIYLNTDLINNKNVSKIIKDRFEEQYSKDPRDFEFFKQTDLKNKILLIDNLHKLRIDDFKDILHLFLDNFDQIFVTMQSKIIEEEKNVLKDIYLEGMNIRLKFLPFFSLKREALIEKVYNYNVSPVNGNNKKILEISKIIESQISFFELSPSFIIMFVENICSNGYASSSNVKIFSSTFISNISTSLAEESNIDVDLAERFLQEIAYHIHKNKEYPIKYRTFLSIIENYNLKHGKKIQHDQYFKSLLSSKFIEKCTFEDFKFVNTNHLAYFIAKEIIKRFISTGDFCEVEYLLNNLCFGINSTILLFISYLTDNENLVIKIIDVATLIMGNDSELDFEAKNVPFLKKQLIEKDLNMPSKEEIEEAKENKYKKEKMINETSKVSKIDIYDYDENEIQKKINKILRNFKIIEIIARILPNFESSLILETKIRFVSAVYEYPNKMLFGILKDINVEDIAEEIIEEIKRNPEELRKGKLPSKEHIVDLINSMNIALILNVYNHFATIVVNKDTIELLDAYKDLESKSSYKIQNLIMHENYSNFDFLIKAAYEYYVTVNDSLIKRMIKSILRKHIITNAIDLSGKNQKYINFFFNEASKRKILYNKQKLITIKGN